MRAATPYDDLIAKMPDGCWIWTGATRGRYGAWCNEYAHRIAVDARPDQHVHHRCGVKLCVNPAHLGAMTRAEHDRLHRRTACGKGHDLTVEANVYEWRGSRHCRVCRNARATIANARRRADMNHARSYAL